MAGYSYPGKEQRARPGCTAPHRTLRTSKHLEWTIFALFLLDCFLQFMSSFPVVGYTLWLINFLIDLLIFGLLYLFVVTRS